MTFSNWVEDEESAVSVKLKMKMQYSRNVNAFFGIEKGGIGI